MGENFDTLMTAVVKDKPEVGLTITKKPIPKDLEDHEVLIKVNYTSVCGTDYHIYTYDDWAKKRLKLPFTAGHEFSGEVVKIGNTVTRVKLGDIVSAETHIICETCEFCLRGEGHICENTKIIGVDTDGCFAEYVRIPAMNCFINSKDANPLYLSVQEPLGNAVHTMAHFPVKGKDVVIVGCGPIGLMGVNVAKAYGAKKIIAAEVNEYRLNYLKAGGGMSMLGIPSKDIDLDVANDIVFKGAQVYGVVGRRIYETWYQVKELIDNDMLDFEKIITHVFPLEDVLKAMEIMGSGNSGKIVLKVGK